LNKSGLGLGSRWLGCNGLCCAIDDLAILYETLDHPVVVTTAENTSTDTGLAEVEVAIIAGAAVIVHIGNGLSAVIAVDREDTSSWASWDASIVADGILALIRDSSKFCKPSITGS
jgi:hypothetical protein